MRVGAEQLVDKAVRKTGLDTYLPCFQRRLRGVRIDGDGRRVRTRGIGSLVDRPLIPGYLFIICPDDRDPPGQSCGIIGFLRFRYGNGALGDLALVSDEEITGLRARVAAGEFDDEPMVAAARVGMVIGDRVRPDDDDRRGLVGTIDAVDEQGRVRVSVELFNRSIPGQISARTKLTIA